MQLLLLGLFVALYLHDATTAVEVTSSDGVVRGVEALPADAWPYLGPLAVATVVLVPKLVLAMLYHASCWRTRRRLGTARGQRSLTRLERFTAALPLLLLGLFIVDLWAGALRVIRLALQHTVLIDELLVLLPTLLVAITAWWSYYPVDRRLREAVIFRLADAGKPVYPVPSRGGYVSLQIRHQFGLLLLPLLVIYAWSESLVLLGPEHAKVISQSTAMMLTPVGVLGVLVLSPLVIRHIWHTTALPSGEVRDRMLRLCQHHRIRVRELLLWRSGGMVNAAVTGLLHQVRYILLSDGLLDQVPPRAVEAVMAHEIAHVKLKHMIWMGLVLVTCLGTIELAGHVAMDLYTHSQQTTHATEPQQVDPAPMIDLADAQTQVIVVGVPAFGVTLLVFGWVSRRIERQADVFAIRHLAESTGAPQRDAFGKLIFDAPSVATMVDALQRVADLNHMPAKRPSWRHGSIAWRQDHLRSLIGSPTDDTAIDRVMLRVKIASLAGLAVLVLSYVV